MSQDNPTKASARDERLKAALRDNLRRRKAQARERRDAAAPLPDGGAEPAGGRTEASDTNGNM
jgi:hypothetical protein